MPMAAPKEPSPPDPNLSLEADVKATVPAAVKDRREPEVNKLFRTVMKLQASDLHLKAGQPPMVRLRGDVQKLNAPPLSQDDMERLLLTNLQPKHRKILDEEGG